VALVVHAQLRGLIAVCALLAAIVGPPEIHVGAEALPAHEPRVAAALERLDGSAATAELRTMLDSNRVRIRFLPMGPGVYARYSVSRHVIEIDDRWMDSDEATLSAVIAHEATHTQDAVSGYLSSGGASACIDSEVRAFRTSAMFWVDRYGPTGKAGPQNELERQLNSIADRQVRDPEGLENLVRQTYTEQCSH
jgi:hypothetical protein